MGIKLNGVHSDTKKVNINFDTIPMLAQLRNNLEQIPGRAGALDYGMEFAEREFLISCSIMPQKNVAELVNTAGNISEWINPYKGLQQLIFDDIPDRYWNVRINQGINLERVVRRGGLFEIEFIAPDPFAYAITDDVYKTPGYTGGAAAENMEDLSGGSYEFTPAQGNMKTQPLINVQGVLTRAQHIILTFNNNEKVRINGPLTADEEFIIDSHKMTAKVIDKTTKETKRNGLGQLESLVFPELLPELNSLKTEIIGGTFTGILIETRSRWL